MGDESCSRRPHSPARRLTPVQLAVEAAETDGDGPRVDVFVVNVQPHRNRVAFLVKVLAGVGRIGNVSHAPEISIS